MVGTGLVDTSFIGTGLIGMESVGKGLIDTGWADLSGIDRVEKKLAHSPELRQPEVLHDQRPLLPLGVGLLHLTTPARRAGGGLRRQGASGGGQREASASCHVLSCGLGRGGVRRYSEARQLL